MWYKEGTISVVQGSAGVTGVGTNFVSNTRTGDMFVGPDGKIYEVVNAHDQLTLGISPAYAGPSVSNTPTYYVVPVQGYVKLAVDRLHTITEGIANIDADVAAAALSAAQAEASRLAAEVAEANAAASQGQASTAETNASASAASSLASATASQTSAEASAASAAQALSSATASDQSADAAAASAAAAAASEGAAAASGLEAAASASAASSSEGAALASETAAAGSAQDAAVYRIAAQNSAAAALGSENDAAGSAAEAAGYRTEAQTARDVTFTARDEAEVARDQAVEAAGTVIGGLVERGNIDLSSGSYPAVPSTSSFWKVTAGGTVSGDEYGVGDTLVYSNTLSSFYKIDNTESVTSVAGFQGVVTKVQLGIDQIDNTPDAAKPVSTAQQSALDLKVAKSDIIDNVTTDDATKVLSAKQGKFLYELLQSNNVSAVAYKFVTTAGQTTLTGLDSGGKNLVYTPGAVMLVTGQGFDYWDGYDYTATDGTSIVFTEAFVAGEEIGVVVFGTFSLADHYTKAEDDAKFVAKTEVIDLAHGGTGATTAAAARTALGLGAAAVAPIVGTVSQSGGVPTGSIIESGSNTNGSYTKYADGTMICRNTVDLGSIAVTQVINSPMHASAVVPGKTFAMPFAVFPNCHLQVISSTATAYVGTPGLPSLSASQSFYIIAPTANNISCTIVITAIGRWFV